MAPPLSSKRGERALWIVVYLGCASLLLAQIAYNFVDIDLWHQMALIRESLASGHLLTHDVYSYAPTLNLVIDHEWGAGAVAFFAAKWAGGAGLVLIKYSVALGVLLLAMSLAQLLGASEASLGFLAPIAVGFLAFGLLPTLRAQAYSFLFSAVLLWSLEFDRRGTHRGLLVWLLLFPLWVNLHGGFVVGLAYVFLYAVEQALFRRRAWLALLALCGMALEVFLNPYGLGYFRYMARALTMSRPRIPEWDPAWSLGATATVFFAVMVIIAIYAVARAGWRVPGVLLLPAAAAEALLHRKMLPFFAIAWVCYVPVYARQTEPGKWVDHFAGKRKHFLVLAWTVLIAVCLVVAARQRFWETRVPQGESDASYPVGATEYLAQQHFHGNLMVPFRVGAYVSWKLYPAVKVSVDSRYEVAYPDQWVEQVFRFYEAKAGWKETLQAYSTDAVLVPEASSVRPLLGAEGWIRTYCDAQFEIYARPESKLPIVDRTSERFVGVFP